MLAVFSQNGMDDLVQRTSSRKRFEAGYALVRNESFVML